MEPTLPIDDEEDVHYLCRKTFVLTIKDAINVVSGKWKLAIVCTMLSGPKGFAEIERLLGTISPRMLTRELRELEINGVVMRKVDDTTNKKSQKYVLTPSGESLEQVITIMANWGLDHRKNAAHAQSLGRLEENASHVPITPVHAVKNS